MAETLIDDILENNRWHVRSTLALEQEVNKVLGYDISLARAQK